MSMRAIATRSTQGGEHQPAAGTQTWAKSPAARAHARAHGNSNRALRRLLAPGGLPIYLPGNGPEQEADRVSDGVAVAASRGTPQIQRVSAPSIGAAQPAPASVQRALAGPGAPLEPGLRQDMERSFGRTFSDVRIHQGAAAAESTQELDARAYTVGNEIVFGSGAFAPGTLEGRRLVAHELTHVVQQSGPALAAMSAGAAPQPLRAVLLQRDSRSSNTKDSARVRVLAAMEKLKQKFDLGAISEENGATWSEAQLAQLDRAFSKLQGDRADLVGLTIIRTDKLESVVRQGKTFKVAGLSNEAAIRFVPAAFRGGLTPLHEAAHVLQAKSVRRAESGLRESKSWDQLEAARLAYQAAGKLLPRTLSREVAEFSQALSRVTEAGGELLASDETNREAKESALSQAQAEVQLGLSQVQREPDAKPWLELYRLQSKWITAVEQWLVEKDKIVGARKNLTEFVEIVTRNKLARRSFAPFTKYVAASWPDKPGEFFAESYATWRSNPNYVKQQARPLFDWFERGAHVTPRRTPLEELARGAKLTFGPAIQKGIEILDVLSGGASSKPAQPTR